jgi:hypothetical protein
MYIYAYVYLLGLASTWRRTWTLSFWAWLTLFNVIISSPIQI